MGILDEAIREHLELKRQHGAADSELKQLEDEAFGLADRPAAPDSLAEAPTEFLAQPDVAGEDGTKAAEPQRSRREGPSIADLQEAPEPAPSAEETPAEEQPAIEHEPVAEVPEPEISPEPEPEPQPEPEPPEPEVEPEPEPAGHSTEERHAIAEQPTELYDVEGELGAGGPSSPSDEELVEQEITEPRLAPADPLAGLEEDEEAEVSVEGPASEEDEDDEFWSEQRLSDELDQALEAPVEEEPQLGDESEAEEPEPSEEQEVEADTPGSDEDVLEETPDFLEETPEDDELWFEQKPPKDFDFDD
jgi:hypothetical protein